MAIADAPGLAVVRTVAMLVDEAADAVQQGVCSPVGADAAMTLRGNYPADPFAWLESLGAPAVVGVIRALDREYCGERQRVSQWLCRQIGLGPLARLEPQPPSQIKQSSALRQAHSSSLEALAKRKGVVRPDGSVTAGNASGINDGACALLLASEAAAARHGLKPRARVVAMATAGLAPRIMGFGPAPATGKVLALSGLSLAQTDVIELNEAFAAQGLAVLRDLGLQDDDPHVNGWGGAIALEHPLGASGPRLVTTAVNQLHHDGGRYALCTVCIEVGQGIALVLKRV